VTVLADTGPSGAVARAATAEVLEAGAGAIRLLLDASQTGGALSAHWAELRDGALGASPHRHSGSSELFCVLDGSMHLLAGDEVVTATAGDLVVVPPNTAHAFAAVPGSNAQLLVVITPGVERFEFFRDLARVHRGELDRETFMAGQERYDTYPAEATVWNRR
jgi:quercetin dioxygenase-like cupin family protein